MGSIRKWPYMAKTQEGVKVGPAQAKLLPDTIFNICGTEVIPCVGYEKIPYWRSKCYGETYDRVGYEMTAWHYGKEMQSEDRGFETEYRIPTSNSYYVADAYDQQTNTVYEFVDSHFSPQKVDFYFDNGYNQVWIFNKSKKKKLKGEMKFLSKHMWQYEYEDLVNDMLPNIDLPTVKGWWE